LLGGVQADAQQYASAVKRRSTFLLIAAALPRFSALGDNVVPGIEHPGALRGILKRYWSPSVAHADGFQRLVRSVSPG